MSFPFAFFLYLSSYQSYAYRKLTVDRKTVFDYDGIKKSISEKMSVTLVCLAGDGVSVSFYIDYLKKLLTDCDKTWQDDV